MKTSVRQYKWCPHAIGLLFWLWLVGAVCFLLFLFFSAETGFGPLNQARLALERLLPQPPESWVDRLVPSRPNYSGIPDEPMASGEGGAALGCSHILLVASHTSLTESHAHLYPQLVLVQLRTWLTSIKYLPLLSATSRA